MAPGAETSDDSESDWKDGGTPPPSSGHGEDESQTQHFFRSPTFLTVSGQLHLESMTGYVFCFFVFVFKTNIFIYFLLLFLYHYHHHH